MPTKSSELNVAINELNSCLSKMVTRLNGVYIIRHDCLVDQHGYLDPVFGRYVKHQHVSVPDRSDDIHLGPEGVKLFVRNIKSSIVPGYKNRIEPKSAPPDAHASRVLSRKPAPASRPRPSVMPNPLPTRTAPWAWPPLPAQFPPPPPFAFPPLGYPPCPPPGSVGGSYQNALVGNSKFRPSYANDRYR